MANTCQGRTARPELIFSLIVYRARDSCFIHCGLPSSPETCLDGKIMQCYSATAVHCSGVQFATSCVNVVFFFSLVFSARLPQMSLFARGERNKCEAFETDAEERNKCGILGVFLLFRFGRSLSNVLRIQKYVQVNEQA